MKSIFKAFAIASFLTLSSCGDSATDLKLYSNTDRVVDGDLTVRYKKTSEVFDGQSKNYMLQFDVYFLNKNPKPMKIKPKSAKVYRESDKAEYGLNFSTLTSLGRTLECDVEVYEMFYVVIPTSTETNYYYFNLKLDSRNITIYFYENPSIYSR